MPGKTSRTSAADPVSPVPPVTMRHASVSTPLGAVWMARSDAGIVRISLRAGSEKAFLRGLPGASRRDMASLADFAGQLRRYFGGMPTEFTVPVDLRVLTPFQRDVLRATAWVPFGRVVSYGAIAAAIGRPGASRAVGNALGSNPVPILIPCHRVIASDGTVGGFTGGTDLKRKLLGLEGISL